MSEERNVIALAEKEVMKADIKSLEEGVARRRLKDLADETFFYYAGVLKLAGVGELEELAISMSSMLVRETEYRTSCIKWQKEAMEKTEVPKFLMPKHTVIVQASVLVPLARECCQIMRENCEFSAKSELELKERKRLLAGSGSFAGQRFYVHLPEKAHLPLEWRALPREEIEGKGLKYNVSPKPKENETALQAYRSAAIKIGEERNSNVHPGTRDDNRKAEQAYLPPGYVGQKISSQELREAFPGLVYESDSDDDEEN